MTEFLGEFIGTCILVFLGDSVVANNSLSKTKGEGAGWISVVLGWGAAVAVAVYVSGFLSAAHLNPAVTFAMAAVGQFAWNKVAMYIIAQMLGAMLGALLVWIHYYPHFQETEDPAAILGSFSTAPGIRSTWSNFAGEALGTAVFVIAVLSLGANELSPGINGLIIGVILIAVGFALGGTTGYGVNPARDLSPRIMHQLLPIKHKGNSDWGYAWIPVVAPIFGGVVGALLYNMVL